MVLYSLFTWLWLTISMFQHLRRQHSLTQWPVPGWCTVWAGAAGMVSSPAVDAVELRDPRIWSLPGSGEDAETTLSMDTSEFKHWSLIHIFIKQYAHGQNFIHFLSSSSIHFLFQICSKFYRYPRERIQWNSPNTGRSSQPHEPSQQRGWSQGKYRNNCSNSALYLRGTFSTLFVLNKYQNMI